MMMYNENYHYYQQETSTTDTSTTCTDATEGYYSYNDSICNDQQQQQQQYYYNEDWDMDLVHEEEEACYAQYDLDMANAVAEADYQDYYCYDEQQQDEYEEEEYVEEEYEEEEQYYDYQSDSLLSLVVGVQSYLTEQEQQADLATKQDSPLYNLQYKMYTYMRQRAYELGVQF